MRSRRNGIAAAAAIALGIAAGAGAPGAAAAWTLEEAAKPYRGQEVVVGVAFVPVLGGALDLLKSDFEKRTGIKVNIEKFDHNQWDAKADADLYARTGHFDLLMMHHNRAEDWVANGHVRFIDDLMKDPKLADPDFDAADLFQPLWDDYCKFDKGRACFLNQNFQMVYWYRKDLFENATEKAAFKKRYGYDLKPARTYKQFQDTAEFFTRKKGESLAGKPLAADFYGVGTVGKREQSLAWELSTFVQGFGGSLFDAEGRPTFTRKENVDAVKYWLGLRRFAPPGVTEAGFIDLFVLLTKGTVAQAIQWTDFAFAIDDPKISQATNVYSYAPIPTLTETMPHGGWGEAEPFVISAYSKRPQVAFLVIQYLASKEHQKKWIEGPGSGLPLRNSSLELPFVKKSPVFGPHVTGMKRGWFNPGYTGWVETQEEWVIAVTEAAAGRMTVEQALEKAQAKAVRLHPKGPINPGQPTRNQFEPLK